MTDFTRKSFNQPDEIRKYEMFKWELVTLGNWTVLRYTLEPGWRWTEHAAPLAETATCQEPHPLWTIISGKMIVQMDDGRKKELGPGEIGFIPPGHDAWVVGDQPIVAIDFQPLNGDS